MTAHFFRELTTIVHCDISPYYSVEYVPSQFKFKNTIYSHYWGTHVLLTYSVSISSILSQRKVNWPVVIG